MTSPEAMIAELGRGRVIAVIREPSATQARQAIRSVVAGGIKIVELTTTTPDWVHILATENVRQDVCLGVGTVTTPEQAQTAISAGAAFLVSPYRADAVREVAAAADVLFIEGGLTPTELARSAAFGPAKLFPAHVGGIEYLTSVKAIMPDATIIPTGGIPLADVPRWLAAGALAVGVGSDLYGDNLHSRLSALSDDLGMSRV